MEQNNLIESILSQIANALTQSVKEAIEHMPTQEDADKYLERNKKVFGVLKKNEWFYDKELLSDKSSYLDEEILRIDSQGEDVKKRIDSLMIQAYDELIIDKMLADIKVKISDKSCGECLDQVFEAYKSGQYYLVYCGCVPIVDYILRKQDRHFSYGTEKAQKAAEQILPQDIMEQPIEIVGNSMAKLFAETFYFNGNQNAYNKDIPSRNNIHGYKITNPTQKGALNCLLVLSILSRYLA